MPIVVQLSLWDILDTASKAPHNADLMGLLDRVEQSIEFLPLSEKLVVAGDAIQRLGEIYADRCAPALEEVELLSYPDREPCVPLDAFDRYVRQSSFVDLERFVEAPELPEVERGYERGSVVRELSVAEALAEVGDEAVTEEAEVARVTDLVLGIAHGEEIEQWASRIRAVMGESERMLLVELRERSGLEFVDLWLGLLLGNTGYTVIRQLDRDLDNGSNFYDRSGIWIVELITD